MKKLIINNEVIEMSEDPIHQNEEGKWCFWDETWSDEIGIYDTREEAEDALEEYILYLG